MYESPLPASLTGVAPANQRMLQGLALGAAVAVDAAAAAALRGTTITAIALFLGLSFGQLALAALWCNRSAQPWWLRGTTTTMIVWGFAWCWGRATYATCIQWFVLLGLFTVLIAVLIAGLPGLFAPRAARPVANALERPARPRSAQWSLRQMLGAMTLLALLLGPGRSLVTAGARYTAVYHLVTVAGIAATTLVAGHVRVRTWLRVAVIMAIILPAGQIVAQLEPMLNAWHWTLAYFLEASVISCGADLLRSTQKSCRSI